MIDKTVATIEDAVAGIQDGATLMVSGFGEAGAPVELMEAVIEQGARNLTIVSNNAGEAYHGLAKLVNERRVAKVICSFPTAAKKAVIKDLYAAGEIELEIVPQGTLSERIRAGGAGIGGFYTPTSFGTKLAEGKETRQFDGQDYVLEFPLFADFAIVKAYQADRWGNLTYDKSARILAPLWRWRERPRWCKSVKLLSWVNLIRNVSSPRVFLLTGWLSLILPIASRSRPWPILCSFMVWEQGAGNGARLLINYVKPGMK